jgi:hypothetical protein
VTRNENTQDNEDMAIVSYEGERYYAIGAAAEYLGKSVVWARKNRLVRSLRWYTFAEYNGARRFYRQSDLDRVRHTPQARDPKDSAA